MNRIFYIIGKSSAGKDTVYKRLLSDFNFNPVIMYTTRPMRENEQHGREYYFVDEICFNKMLRDGVVIEYRVYNTVCGDWFYFTAENSVNISLGNCLGIGTLDSFLKMKKFFADAVVPIYIESDDYIRLKRAIEREHNQKSPKYTEICRRFIADDTDFSDEKLLSAGINVRFQNDGDIETCISKIKKYLDNFTEV